MPNYTGNSCPACGKVFGEGDDIVVCPVCGSPHHRQCYKAMGHCGNEELHAQGVKWEADPSLIQEELPQDGFACRQCGATNPQGNIFCQACGHRMGAEPTPGDNRQQGTSPFTGFMQMQNNLDYTQTLAEGVTVKEACDYVGPNSLSFMMKFKMLQGRGAVSFNWGAFIFGFSYCFYRKMYKLGAVLLGLFVLSSIPTGYYSAIAISDILAANGTLGIPIEFVMDGKGYQGLMIASSIARMVTLASTVYCGFFFNKLYFANTVAGVRRVRETGHFSTGSQEYSYALGSAGGVNKGAVLILVSAIVFAYIAYGYIASFIILS